MIEVLASITNCFHDKFGLHQAAESLSLLNITLRQLRGHLVSTHYHAIIWIDHREARVFHFSPTEVEQLVLHPHNPTRHIHHKANSIGSGHAAEDQNFLQAVTESIAHAGAVLITGPANAKTELVKYIHRHHPKVMNAIAAVETVDHPSDGALVAYARKYFKAADLMHPQSNSTTDAPTRPS